MWSWVVFALFCGCPLDVCCYYVEMGCFALFWFLLLLWLAIWFALFCFLLLQMVCCCYVELGCFCFVLGCFCFYVVMGCFALFWFLLLLWLVMLLQMACYLCCCTWSAILHISGVKGQFGPCSFLLIDFEELVSCSVFFFLSTNVFLSTIMCLRN